MLACIALGICLSWLAWPIEIKVDKDVGQFWPAWAQAIGSLLGIGIAMYIPWRQRQQQLSDARASSEREQQRERASVLTMQAALFQPIEGFRAHCAILPKWIDAPLAERQQIPVSSFDRAPEFDQFRPTLHLMGALGIRVSMLIALQDLLRGMLPTLHTLPDIDGPYRERVLAKLSDGERMAAEIRDELQDRVEQGRRALDHAAT